MISPILVVPVFSVDAVSGQATGEFIEDAKFRVIVG
jgi:hypothetical protein